MSYESKIYIVEKNDSIDDDGMRYAQVIAMFDMCNMGALISVFTQKTDCYFYSGNEKVLEDKYGGALKEAKLEDVIYVLEESVKNGENYRRIFPLLSALKTFYEQQKDNKWGEIVVLHYGY